MTLLVAQAGLAGYSLPWLICLAIVIGAVVAVLNVAFDFSPRIKMVINIVALAIVAIIAVKVLFALL